MKFSWIATFFLGVYTVFLVKVMVFKEIPVIRVGQIMLNFGGTQDGQANLIPFKTILPYMLGDKGLIIAGINLVGNIALLVPLGFVLPFLYRSLTWKTATVIGIVSGLTIEVLQTVLHVGIFDIDDVILNALGFVLGYLMYVFLTKWLREKKYLNIGAATVALLAAGAGAVYAIYPFGQPVIDPRMGADTQSGGLLAEQTNGDKNSKDLCGGTGGNGEIVSLGDNSFTLDLKNGRNQIIKLINGAEISTPIGPGSMTDLKVGDRVTLVGGPNSDGTFTAEAIFVCS